jgi:hypothetical protein
MCGLTTRERQTAASTAPMPHPRPGRRGQAPRPRSGAPKAKGLTAAIAVVAKSNVPSFALKFTCVEGPIGASDTPAIYTTLTDVTLKVGAAKVSESGACRARSRLICIVDPTTVQTRKEHAWSPVHRYSAMAWGATVRITKTWRIGTSWKHRLRNPRNTIR